MKKISIIYANDLTNVDISLANFKVLTTILPRLLKVYRNIQVNYPLTPNDTLTESLVDAGYDSVITTIWGPDFPKDCEWQSWTPCKDYLVPFWLHENGDIIIYLSYPASPALMVDFSGDKKYLRFDPMLFTLSAYTP